MQGMTERLEAMLAKGTDNMLLRFSLGKAYAEQDCYGDAEGICAWRWNSIPTIRWPGSGWAGLPGAGRQGRARAAWESGLEAARARGDQQVVKELQVFMKRLDKQA